MGQSIHPAYVLDMLKNGELLLMFYPHLLDSVLQRFRRDPKDLALPWQVSDEEMIDPRAFVQDRPQVEQDSSFIEEPISSSA